MKNKILHILVYIIFNFLIYSSVSSAEQFNFDVTEIEILQNGNVIKGLNKGSINTNNGITITADTFVYNKSLNILTTNGNVKIKDLKNNLEIYAENIIYEKNKEILTTDKNSKAILDSSKFIYANTFKLFSYLQIYVFFGISSVFYIGFKSLIMGIENFSYLVLFVSLLFNTFIFLLISMLRYYFPSMSIKYD